MDEDRWVITVEFDPPGANEEIPLGEAAGFYGHLLRHWGEESEEDIEWEGDTVKATFPVLDHIYDPVAWLLSNTVPSRIELVRNDPRGVPWQ